MSKKQTVPNTDQKSDAGPTNPSARGPENFSSGERISEHDEKRPGTIPRLKVGPSDRTRPARASKRLASEKERARRMLKDAGAPISEPLVIDTAVKAIRAKEEARDTPANRKWRGRVCTADVGQQSAGENDVVMLAALMAQPEVKEFVRQASQRDPKKRGRPTDDGMAAKTLLAALLGEQHASIAAAHRAISRNDMPLHTALGFPLNHSCGRHLNTVYDSIKRIGGRVDPALWQNGAIETHRALAPILGADAMLCNAIDGTWFRSGTIENRSGSCDEEADLIDPRMQTRVKGYGRMDIVRGYLLTVLSPTKSAVPLVWDLGVAGRPVENGAAPAMLKRLYDRWPRADLQFIVGDSKYDTEDLARLLQFGYAIHPVFARHGGHGVPAELDSGGWRGGVLHGSDGEPMEYLESDGFQTPEARREAGLELGEIARYIDGKQPRVRFRKPGPDTASGKIPRNSFYTWHHPRFHTFLPHAPSHADRWAARQEMMAARNVAESANATLQFDGLDRGASAPRYLNSLDVVHHFVGAKAWAMGRRKLVRLNGDYERMEHHFRRRGLLSEAVYGRHAHHDQLLLFA